MITRLEQKYITIQHKTRTIQGEQSKNPENYHYNFKDLSSTKFI